jgi:uncharacterized protein (TIGR03437 family)
MQMKKIITTFLALSLVSATGMAFGQTGTPAIDSFDQTMNYLLAKYHATGATIALTDHGRLVMARGYGFSDEGKTIPTQPDARFRIASLSKLITSVTVMHLVELGKLSLDQPAFALLPDVQAPAGQKEDPRLESITIRQLLTHSGGWDDSSQGSGFDATWNSPVIAAALNVPAPVSTENTIRYMRGQPLDFTPGTRYAYSNLGYAVLGRIIEHVTGMSYEQYVRTNVLAPMGIENMRIGQTFLQGKLPGEMYYESTGKTTTVFPDVTPQIVPWAYGGWYVESQDAQGSWVASAIDYAKFMNAIDGWRGKAFLQPSSVAQMTARPSIPVWATDTSWYGFGTFVTIKPQGLKWSHSGAMEGVSTYQIRTATGQVWIVFLNWDQRTEGAEGGLDFDIDNSLTNAAAQVTNWPAGDYFVNFYDADPVKAAAKPALTTREGVVNGATMDRGVVSGSWVTLFGVNLAPKMRSWTSADFNGNQLPTSLDGVSVNIDGKPAAVSYISPAQINVQAPAGLPEGWVTAEVINNGVSTGLVLTHAVNNAPGAFTYLADGLKFAVATDQGGKLLGPDAPAHAAMPGETITIYSTGLAPSAAGSKFDSFTRVNGVTLTIGGKSAVLQFAGLISPGLFQINAVVPAVAAGNQPVVISIEAKGKSSPSDVFIPIAAH